MGLLTNARHRWSRSWRRSYHRGSQTPLRVEVLEQRELLNTTQYPLAKLPIKQSPFAYAIREMYGDLLLPAPAPAEVATWDNALKSGMSRQQMALAFVNSSEFRANLVRHEYGLLLNREADPAGL